MSTSRFVCFQALAVSAMAFLSASPVFAQTAAWNRLFGDVGFDHSQDVSADENGKVFISGFTQGDDNEFDENNFNAFLTKYDAEGNLGWSRLINASREDMSAGVSADKLGSVFISGTTFGDLDGANAGGHDVFVSKYGTDGTLDWTRQLGSPSDDWSAGVSADQLGNVFLTGWSEGNLVGGFGSGGAFVSKYDSDGNLDWTRQFGPSGAQGKGISADGLGNVYVTGYDVPGPFLTSGDTFVKKFDTDGNLIWTRGLNLTPIALGLGISADKRGNVFASGLTQEMYSDPEAFLIKYDAEGNIAWTRELGLISSGSGVSTDGRGNVFLTGSRREVGEPYVSKYDTEGNLVWTTDLMLSYIGVDDVVTDGKGNVFLTGATDRPLGGDPLQGNFDAYVIKINDLTVPEPTSLLLISSVLTTYALRRRSS